jgi:hypothetical protein
MARLSMVMLRRFRLSEARFCKVRLSKARPG